MSDFSGHFEPKPGFGPKLAPWLDFGLEADFRPKVPSRAILTISARNALCSKGTGRAAREPLEGSNPAETRHSRPRKRERAPKPCHKWPRRAGRGGIRPRGPLSANRRRSPPGPRSHTTLSRARPQRTSLDAAKPENDSARPRGLRDPVRDNDDHLTICCCGPGLGVCGFGGGGPGVDAGSGFVGWCLLLPDWRYGRVRRLVAVGIRRVGGVWWGVEVGWFRGSRSDCGGPVRWGRNRAGRQNGPLADFCQRAVLGKGLWRRGVGWGLRHPNRI